MSSKVAAKHEAFEFRRGALACATSTDVGGFVCVREVPVDDEVLSTHVRRVQQCVARFCLRRIVRPTQDVGLQTLETFVQVGNVLLRLLIAVAFFGLGSLLCDSERSEQNTNGDDSKFQSILLCELNLR